MANDGVSGILSELEKVAAEHDKVSVGDIVDAIGHRGTGVFLMVPGLVGLTPLAGVPTVPTILAVIVVVLAAQIVFGCKKMWLPDFLRDRDVDEDRLRKALRKSEGAARKLDKWFGNRLEVLTSGIAMRVAAGVCILLACLVPPLELLPFAAALPMAAIAAFGLGLTLRDGAVMLVAFAISAGALYGAWTMMP